MNLPRCTLKRSLQWAVCLTTLGVLCYLCRFSAVTVNRSERAYPIQHNSGPHPIQHVYYLNVYNSQRTTMYSILAELCHSRKLLPLRLKNHHPFGVVEPFHKDHLQLVEGADKYDVVFDQHIYTPDIFEYLHKDTFKFTILQEPLSQTASSFFYFLDKLPYLKNIPSDHPFDEYLSNPGRHEAIGYKSFTNNRQSMDLGYNLTHSFTDEDYTREFISKIEKRFDLVLIAEYFDVSLIILKRRLGWSTRDILYWKKDEIIWNEQTDITSLHRERHRRYSLADVRVYSHFLHQYEGMLEQEGYLEGELLEFRSILDKVSEFCDGSHFHSDPLILPAGQWHERISVRRSKCSWLRQDKSGFDQHFKSLDKPDPNYSYLVLIVVFVILMLLPTSVSFIVAVTSC